MKRRISVLLCVMALALMLPVACSGKTVTALEDTVPFVLGGRTFFPVRQIAEYFAIHTSWDANSRTVTLENRYTTIVVQIGSNIMIVRENSQENVVEMDVCPIIQDGRTMLPIRYWCEAFGLAVIWEDATKSVTISREDRSMTLRIGSTEIIQSHSNSYASLYSQTIKMMYPLEGFIQYSEHEEVTTELRYSIEEQEYIVTIMLFDAEILLDGYATGETFYDYLSRYFLGDSSEGTIQEAGMGQGAAYFLGTVKTNRYGETLNVPMGIVGECQSGTAFLLTISLSQEEWNGGSKDTDRHLSIIDDLMRRLTENIISITFNE